MVKGPKKHLFTQNPSKATKMKKRYNFIALVVAAVMTIGSVTLASCDKEADNINPQNQIAATMDNHSSKGLQFFVDEWFHDSTGHCWHIKGYGQWIINNGVRNGVVLDIKFMQAGQQTYTFNGSAVWNIESDPAQVTITTNSGLISQQTWNLIRDYSKYLLF